MSEAPRVPPSGTSAPPTSAPPTSAPPTATSAQPSSRPSAGRSGSTTVATSKFPAVPGYEIQRELGRGGMGVVYKARQLGVNRTVALKMILGGAAASQADLARFRLEAQAVGRFSHPGVVAVHEVGEFEGLPYFSLEFVGGGTLAQQLNGRPMAPRAAAELLAAVAEAVHAAHKAGVIHRDLKPSNILLTDEGRPKVADFGLAKRLDPGSEGPTRTGEALGTPSYMAPEQLEASASVAPTADVYSLGAVLYELLTGRPPFVGESDVNTLWMVMSQEPVSLRQLAPRTPVDLETIAHKCLHKDPRRRYGSALELSADLRRWLRGEAIQARPVGSVEQAVRWCRRNPVVAGLSVAILLAAIGGLSGLTLKWREAEELRQLANANRAEVDKQRQELVAAAAAAAERRREAEENAQSAERARAEALHQRTAAEAAKREADQQRAAAEENFQAARAAVNRYFTEVSQNRLLKVPGLQPLRKQLMEAALGFYQGFLAQRGSDDFLLNAEIAEANERVAELTYEIGDKTAASGAFQKSIKLLTKLCEQSPNDPELRHRLAQAYSGLAGTQLLTGKIRESLQSAGYAIELERTVVQTRPLVTYRRTLAMMLSNYGYYRQFVFELDKATQALGESRDLFEGLLRESPADAQLQHNLSSCLMNLGITHTRADRYPEAQEAFERAVKIVEALLATDPTDADLRISLSKLYSNLGTCSFHTDHNEKALEWHQRSMEIREKLAAENPAVTDYTKGVADGLSGQASVQRSLKRYDAAVASLLRAAELYGQLARENPKESDLFAGQAMTLMLVGEIYADQQRVPEALAKLADSRAIMEKLAREVPDDPGYDSILGVVWGVTGTTCKKADRLPEAIAAYEQAVTASVRALTKAPTIPNFRTNLLTFYLFLAETRRKNGQVPLAAAAARDALKLKPNDAETLVKVAVELAACAGVATESAESREVLAVQAVGLLRQALATGAKLDADAWDKDDRLKPLHGRADYKALRAGR